MPTVQQLRYLVAVADTLHFRRAAEICNVTQPTLSAQLRQLELRLGIVLVERNRSRVLMTAVGADIAERARRVLREVEDIRQAARHGRAPLTGTLRAGVVQSLGSYLFPLIAPELHASYPGLKLYIREGLPDPLLRQLETGALDFLFYPLPLDRADIETVAIFDEPLIVVTPRDHPLAAKAEVARSDLKGETLLTLEAGHRLYEQLSALAQEFEAHVSHDYEGTSLDTLRQMVAMGMGVSLLPALYVRSEVARESLVVARPIAGVPPSRVVGIAWRRGTARAEEFRTIASLAAQVLARDVPEVTVLLTD
jgi:LysR family hydrogen peroxide-inducible transcriptional activator